MKHFSRACKSLALLLLSASLTIGASAASLGVGTVNASALRLRSQPSTSASTLQLVYRGSSVNVLEDAADGWYLVSYNGMEGYMSAEYLTVTRTEETEENGLGNGQVTLSTGSLNIRDAASSSGSRIGTIPNGTVVALSEYTDGWYLVTYNNITGYVAEQYITPVEATANENTTSGNAVVEEAMKYLGCPYVYGGSSPSGFDCSGFTSYIYKKFGYSINRTVSSQLNNNGASVSYSDLQPGDLVFFRDYSTTKSASHVGIYIGNGHFIHASTSSTGVRIDALSSTWYANRYVGAKRILA